MKKILGLLIVAMLTVGMCGCETVESINASTATEATTETFDEEGSDIEYYTLGDITFPIPSTWTLTKNDDSYAYYFCPTNNVEDHTPILTICLISLDDVSTSLIRNESDSVFDAIFKGFDESGELTISTKKDLDGYSEYPGKYISGTEMINDTHYVFESYLTLYDTNCYDFQLSIPKDAKNTYSDDLEQIVAATTYGNDEADDENSDDDDSYTDSEFDDDSSISTFEPKGDSETIDFDIIFCGDFRNDATGRWRFSTYAESNEFQNYVLNYYDDYFQDDSEVHVVYNFTNKTVYCITKVGGMLSVNVTEYVKGEEHDAKLACSGTHLATYMVYLDNGVVEKF